MRSVAFLLREFVHSLSQNRFLHFTYGAQVSISLLVLGIFFVLLVGAAIFWSKLGEQMEVHVFLDDTISSQQINQLETDLGSVEHVATVSFRSKEDALKLFAEKNRNMPLGDLQMENPLPNSFVIGVDRPSNIEAVAQHAETMPGVLSVRYGQQILNKYMKMLAILIGVCIVTISLLIIFTYSSINNIIALSIYARRAEIRIMQLVGATWWFIRWPFLFEGLFFGIVGALIALALIVLLLIGMGQALRLSDLSLAVPQAGLTSNQIVAGLGILVFGLGLIVGFFGSLRTVNTFLNREGAAQQPSRRAG